MIIRKENKANNKKNNNTIQAVRNMMVGIKVQSNIYFRFLFYLDIKCKNLKCAQGSNSYSTHCTTKILKK